MISDWFSLFFGTGSLVKG